MDWLTYVLDFTVVVAGIFAGLQVNKWNNERQDRKTEKKYISRLLDDTQKMLSGQQLELKWNSSRVDSNNVVLQALRSGSLEDERRESFEHGLAYLGQLIPVRRRWGTVIELQSTGRLSILKDMELRILLGEIETSFDFSEQVWTVQRNQISFLLKNVTTKFEILESGFVEADKVNIIYDFEELCADKEFRLMVSQILVYSKIIKRANERHHNNVERLAKKLKILADGIHE